MFEDDTERADLLKVTNGFAKQLQDIQLLRRILMEKDCRIAQTKVYTTGYKNIQNVQNIVRKDDEMVV